MKFLTFSEGKKEYLGVLKGDKIYSISDDARFSFLNMVDLISNITEEDMKYLEEKEGNIDYNHVKILSPIRKPIHDVICVGENYVEYI